MASNEHYFGIHLRQSLPIAGPIQKGDIALLVIDRWKIQRGIAFLLTDRCTPGSYAWAGPDATERYVPVCFVGLSV
jgi:hypothetical protein